MNSRRLLVSSLAALAIASVSLSAHSDAPVAPITAVFVDPNAPDIADVRKKGEDAINRLGYAMVTEVTRAVAKDGVENAVDISHLKKISMTGGRLTDLPNITAFKRTSLRLRDRANAPDAGDALALQRFQQELTTGTEVPTVLVQRIDQPNAAPEWRVYRPFGALPVCLKCHGDRDEQSPELRAKLDQLYPLDQSVGYAASEWRGVLRVTVDLMPPPAPPKPTAQPATDKATPKKKS